jgi:hypothetical protein
MEVDSLDDLVLILTAHEQNDVLKYVTRVLRITTDFNTNRTIYQTYRLGS